MLENEVEARSRKQIQYGALLSYAAIAINVLAGILYTPWIIHHLGSGNYGLYTIATSLISMFVMDFGISAALSKYISEYRAEGKEEKINQLINVTVQLYLLIDAVILIILVAVYFFLDVIYAKLTLDELERFRVVYLIVAGFNIVSFPFIPLGGVLGAYEKFISLNLCDIINKVLTVFLTIIAIYRGMGLYTLVTINAVVGLFIIAVKFVLVRRSFKLRLNLRYRDRRILKMIFQFSVWVTVMMVAQRFIYNLTPSIIGALIGPVSVTVFGVASTLEGYSYSLGNVFSSMFLPKITRIMAQDDNNKVLTELMIRMGRIELYILGLILIGFTTVGKEFIYCWMGRDYEQAYYCAILLIAPNLLIWPMTIATTALTVGNRVKEHAIVNVVMAVINIALELLVVPWLGIIGAAVAIFFSYLFKAICMMVLYKKYVNVKLSVFIKGTYVRLLLPLGLALAVAVAEGHFIAADGWKMLALKAFVIGTSYLVVMYFCGLDTYEKSWVKSKFPRNK